MPTYYATEPCYCTCTRIVNSEKGYFCKCSRFNSGKSENPPLTIIKTLNDFIQFIISDF